MGVQSVLLAAACIGSSSVYALGGKSPTPNGDVFDQHTIPEAQCGDGSPYSLYIREGDPKKVLVHFEGGGACWGDGSCFGKIKFTSLKDSPGLSKNKYLGKHVGEDAPFQDFTYVYVPYCTGDLHAGSHAAKYKDKTVLHYGRTNFTKSLAWLESEKKRLVSSAEDLVVFGESAGALGVLSNLDQISKQSNPQARKLALVDSPGLHFNDDLWGRFTKEYLADMDQSLAANAMHRDPASGILAPELKNFCRAHSDWKIGFSQSTQDLMMSALFGNITPVQHYSRVMGSQGIHQTLEDPNDNCASWVPDTTKHVFSSKAKGWKHETWDGVSNSQFVRGLYTRDLKDQHPSHH